MCIRPITLYTQSLHKVRIDLIYKGIKTFPVPVEGLHPLKFCVRIDLIYKGIKTSL